MATRDYPRILVAPPGPKGKAIVARDAEWTSTSYIKEYPLVIAGGKGAMVEDVDGNRFIDFMAGIAVSSTGYNHPKVVGAIKDAADKFLHICGTDFYFEGFAALAERLAKLAPGKSKKRTFLSNSGTEAVEAAIKLARNHTRRSGLIAFHQSFHGRTYGAMSLTSSKVKQHAHFGPLLPEVYHVPYANPYKLGGDAAAMSYSLGAIEDLFTRQIHPEDVAGIFLEPIQGEGGYVIPPVGFLTALRELCDKHGIMLVFDEVQSGVG
ncbi:MAG: aminotransferase class III-fold pyridoxal phosphate-dependent enzyme, partial [Gemmatimonadota bacterium]